MTAQSPFRRLRTMFQERFFENDTVAPGSGFETNIYQVMGTLVTVGFFVTYFSIGAFMEFTVPDPRAAATASLVRAFRLFLPALCFALIGFTTVFEWDMLFPDRRDFLILSLFPVSLRDIFLAKVAALATFLFLLIGALNAFPTLAVVSFAADKAPNWGIAVRLVLAQTLAASGAAVFAFLLVAALQGILLNVTSPRIFRRISPWMQTIGMSVTVMSVSTFPVYVQLLKPAVESRAAWLWLFPPLWFTGLYDLLLPDGDPFFRSLGRYGIAATALGFLVFCLTWSLGFRRHFRRTLEADDTLARRPARDRLRWLAASPEEWAIFAFCRKTLARSTKHRLFLATWLSVGISAGLFVALSVDNGKLAWSPDGARSFPFLIAFFVVSGLRTVFQFPADLACNWILQITESRWGEVARRAARKVVFVSGLAPLFLLILCGEVLATGIGRGLVHVLFQIAAAALLSDVMFWNFGKVPFTCSYFAGKMNLVLLAVFYVYGFTSYSFNLADLEKALDEHLWGTFVFFAASAAALAVLWRRSPAPSEVIFDGSEPLIQTLNLN